MTDTRPSGELETKIVEDIPGPFRHFSTRSRCFLDLWEGALERLTVEEVSLPHFEIDERPQPLGVIGRASRMFLDEPP